MKPENLNRLEESIAKLRNFRPRSNYALEPGDPNPQEEFDREIKALQKIVAEERAT